MSNMQFSRGFNPFVLIFCLVVVAPAISADVAILRTDYYQKTCPDFHKIVREAVTTKQVQQPTTAAGTLRLFFHDCFLEGCDASVLIATNSFNKAERDDDLNDSLPGDAFDIVTRIKTALELSCPGVVSCADILAQATRDLVTMVGGPYFEVKLGRKDGFESKAHKVRGNVPMANQTVPDIHGIFKKNGFSLREMVALSGAHTIGFSHCKEFADRLYGSKADKEINPRFAAALKDLCKNHTVDDTIAAFNDVMTPGKFDNMYFKNLKRGLGLLASDHILIKDNSTKPFVDLYATNETAFFEDFARAMEKLGTVGVKGDKEGEVRRRCDHFNNLNV
ncbi:hem peroxidase [Arabidopsis thaliana x Arabidopsis arenosa]|uniref:peroxidase n=1 Tax=Arabidopsis thaliana x Arabidopsis arenosa TaxID=1240361 RepID=A0A8T1XEC4_9BRAS|nr:hem peroxidase [Arabidopsis thaliana x Arabidopsis arenosa]